MSKHTEGFTKSIASSRNWFRSELLPDDIKLQCQLLERSTTIQYYDGIKLFYVEDGEGSLIVNGKSYPLWKNVKTARMTLCIIRFYLNGWADCAARIVTRRRLLLPPRMLEWYDHCFESSSFQT